MPAPRTDRKQRHDDETATPELEALLGDLSLSPQALAGVRVVDLGWVLAAPYATMLLGYLGAEVIKVESRRRIDEQRIAHRAGFSKDYDASSNFFEVNLTKRSVTLNLATPKGAELTRRLVSTSDVVIENMRPGVIDRLGSRVRGAREGEPEHHHGLGVRLGRARPAARVHGLRAMLLVVQRPGAPHRVRRRRAEHRDEFQRRPIRARVRRSRS